MYIHTRTNTKTKYDKFPMKKHNFSNKKNEAGCDQFIYTYTHTHTHIYIYTYMQTCTHTVLKTLVLQNLDDSWDNENTTVQMPPRDPNKPLPAWATDPDNMEITDEEKQAIPEFFCGRYVGEFMCIVLYVYTCMCMCVFVGGAVTTDGVEDTDGEKQRLLEFVCGPYVEELVCMVICVRMHAFVRNVCMCT